MPDDSKLLLVFIAELKRDADGLDHTARILGADNCVGAEGIAMRLRQAAEMLELTHDRLHGTGGTHSA